MDPRGLVLLPPAPILPSVRHSPARRSKADPLGYSSPIVLKALSPAAFRYCVRYTPCNVSTAVLHGTPTLNSRGGPQAMRHLPWTYSACTNSLHCIPAPQCGTV